MICHCLLSNACKLQMQLELSNCNGGERLKQSLCNTRCTDNKYMSPRVSDKQNQDNCQPYRLLRTLQRLRYVRRSLTKLVCSQEVDQKMVASMKDLPVPFGLLPLRKHKGKSLSYITKKLV